MEYQIYSDDEDVAFESYATDHINQALSHSTPKIPPGYDGRTSWFAYEEAIDDWCDICVLNDEKKGPSLRNRLFGDAAVYKPLLDRDRLRDPLQGVNYFKTTLRPHFVKGSQSVFLWRFYQLLRCYRGTQDLLRWTGRLTVLLKRVQDAWMDLLQEVAQDDALFLGDFADAVRRAQQNGEQPPTQDEAFRQWNTRRRERHQAQFPLGQNLFGLMFTVQADLSEQQRERLSSYMSQRGIAVEDYNFTNLKEAFIELFCAPRNSIADPSYRTTSSSQPRSYCVLDYGECEGSWGYWVQDDDTGEEGFVEEFDNGTFWAYEEENDAFVARRFIRPRLRKGKGKGGKRRKGKGKGRGSKGRRRFRPYANFGKGPPQGGTKGPSHDTPFEFKGKGKGKGKKGGKGKGKGKPYSNMTENDDSGIAQTASDPYMDSAENNGQQESSSGSKARSSQKTSKHVTWAAEHDQSEWSEQSWDTSWYGSDQSQAWQSQSWDGLADWYEEDPFSHATWVETPDSQRTDMSLPTTAGWTASSRDSVEFVCAYCHHEGDYASLDQDTHCASIPVSAPAPGS